ncbi:MAG: hypothetical protein ABW109_07030 [Candidatus Thiodiazotropha sp. 6PLUC4]
MANQTGAIVAKPENAIAVFDHGLVELWRALATAWRHGREFAE